MSLLQFELRSDRGLVFLRGKSAAHSKEKPIVQKIQFIVYFIPITAALNLPDCVLNERHRRYRGL
jgi:hypothetical protein